MAPLSKSLKVNSRFFQQFREISEFLPVYGIRTIDIQHNLSYHIYMKTKYIAIKDYLNDLISKGDDSDILPSESELCASMEVSRITVRKALSALEQEGLLFKQKGKGAFISKKPTGNCKVLNIFLGISKDFRFSSADRIMAGVLDYMKESGNGLHIFMTDKNMNETLKNIQQHKIDGIIGIMPHPLDLEIYEELRQKGFPIILVNRPFLNSHYSYVSADFSKAAFLATDALLRHGHKKIMLVGTSKWILYSQYIVKGFSSALIKYGMGKKTYEIVNVDDFETEDSFLAEMAERFENKFDALNPSAIIGLSEPIFSRAVYPFLQKKGFCIPADIEVALCSKTLETTPQGSLIHEIRYPEYEIGRKSMDALEQMIRGKTNKVNILLEPELIEKEFVK